MYRKFHVHLKDFILFLERVRGERGEKHQYVLPLVRPLLGTWAATQACALDWELNQLPFGWQAVAQSTEPHQPGQKFHVLTHITFS